MTRERGLGRKSKKHLYGASVSMNTSRSSTKNSTLSTSAGSAAVTSASISDRPKRKSLCAGLVIRIENPLRVRTCGGFGRGFSVPPAGAPPGARGGAGPPPPEVERRGGARVRGGRPARGRDPGRRFGHCGGGAGAGRALEEVGRLGKRARGQDLETRLIAPLGRIERRSGRRGAGRSGGAR